MIDDGLNYRIVNGRIIWFPQDKPMTEKIPFSKEETLKSYDAAIDLFEKQIADIRAGITLLKKLRELSAEKPND